MLNMRKKLIMMAIITATVAGCANPDTYSGDVYTADRAKQVQTISYGTIQSVRAVKIQAEDSSIIGTIGGAVVGGLLGRTIGGGTGQDLMSAAGAIGGAAAGKTVNDKLNQVKAAELEIKKDNGDVIVVVQKTDPSFQPGAKIRMSHGNGRVNVAVIN